MAALRELLAFFEIGVDDSALKSADKSLAGIVDRVKGVLKAGVFAVVAKKVSDFALETFESADALKKQAQSLGVTIGELQALHHAGELAGVSQEGLTAAIARLQRGAAEFAETGKGPAAAALRAIGIEVRDSSGNVKNAAVLFEEAAGALSGMEDPARRNAAAAQIFGKQFLPLIPLLQEGSEGIAKARIELEELGATFTEEFAARAEVVNDQLTRLNRGWQGLKLRIATVVLPFVERLAGKALELAKVFIRFVRTTKVVEAGLVGLGVKGFLMLSRAIGPLGPAFARLAGFILKTVLPLLILEDFLVFLAGGKSVFGRALDKIFGPGTQEKVRAFVDDVKKAVLDFFADVASRPAKLVADVRLLFKTLGKDVRSAFEAVGEAVEGFFDWVGGKAEEVFGTTVGDAIRSLGDVAGSVFDFLGEHFGETVAGMGEGMLGVLDMMTGGWDNFVSKLSAIGEGLVIGFELVWDMVRGSALTTVASIADAFAGLWNSVLLGASNLVLSVGGALAKVPGMKDVAAKVILSSADLLGGLVPANREASARQDVAARIGGLAARAKVADTELRTRRGFGSGASADGGGTVVNTTVNVPAGTPEKTAQRVATAAERGAKRGAAELRAAKAATANYGI